MGPVCNSAVLLWKSEVLTVGNQRYFRPCGSPKTHECMPYKWQCVLSLDQVLVQPLKWLSPGHLAVLRRKAATLGGASNSKGDNLGAGVWSRADGGEVSLTAASAMMGFAGLLLVMY